MNWPEGKPFHTHCRIAEQWSTRREISNQYYYTCRYKGNLFVDKNRKEWEGGRRTQEGKKQGQKEQPNIHVKLRKGELTPS